MICPVCETESGDEHQCAECGMALMEELIPDEEPEPVEGFEPTQAVADDLDGAFALAALDEAPVETVEGLEPTLLFDPRAPVEVEPLELDGLLASVERESVWSTELPELESGRSEDGLPRTPAPDESGPCPFCGLPGSGAVCAQCGRRRRRYVRAAAAESAAPGTSPDQTMLCPACFTRVLVDARCPECHAPLPRQELL